LEKILSRNCASLRREAADSSILIRPAAIPARSHRFIRKFFFSPEFLFLTSALYRAKIPDKIRNDTEGQFIP